MAATGRPPKRRVNYINDAQALLILVRAIEVDDSRPIQWREFICSSLSDIASELINAPKIQDEKVKA